MPDIPKLSMIRYGQINHFKQAKCQAKPSHYPDNYVIKYTELDLK